MKRKEEIEARKLEIKKQVKSASDVKQVEELEKEVEALNSELEQIKKTEEVKKTEVELEEKSFQAKEIERKEEHMNKLTRNSKEYIDAYARYIKTNNDEEVRGLLSENVTDGTIAVPDLVYDQIKTAWDNEQIMSLVPKNYAKGNLKIQFEISGDDAVIHTEGSAAIDEEDLKEGIVTLTPESIKKYISISEEAYDMSGEKFLEYIYSELSHKIVKKAADTLVEKIAKLPQKATSTSPSAAKITMNPSTTTISTAYGNLSDEATNPVITMNKLTYADFKKVQYDNNYGVDIFEGFDVKFNNTLPAYSAAKSGDVYMLVGDYEHGTMANFPNGEEVKFIFDNITEAAAGMIKVHGREYVGLGAVADKAFTLVAKPSTDSTPTPTPSV